MRPHFPYRLLRSILIKAYEINEDDTVMLGLEMLLQQWQQSVCMFAKEIARVLLTQDATFCFKSLL